MKAIGIILTVIVLVSPALGRNQAVANVLNQTDYQQLHQLQGQLLALENDLQEFARTDRHTLATNPAVNSCFDMLSTATSDVFQYMEMESTLVDLSADMRDPLDELLINSRIAIKTETASKALDEESADINPLSRSCESELLITQLGRLQPLLRSMTRTLHSIQGKLSKR